MSEGAGGLVYAPYANEGQTNAINTIPDFSRAGYRGGGVPIPFVSAEVTLTPSGGDDTTAIQNAIKTVSALPLVNGVRGAILLNAGNYAVSSTLNINADGVVIRGKGQQATGGTTITYTATTKSDVFHFHGSRNPSYVGGSAREITDAYVPVGAKTLNLTDTSPYSPGDMIRITHLMNQQWIDDIGMTEVGGLAGEPNDPAWNPASFQLKHDRYVVAVNGNELTLDAPIVQAIEDQYGGGKVEKFSHGGAIENVGIESIRLESTYTADDDENHGWEAIEMRRVKNGWVRQVTSRYFGRGLVLIDDYSQFITVEDSACLDPKSITTGGRKYSFYVDDSTYNLVQRCLTRGGRHDFASGSLTPGPNAFVDGLATQAKSDIGPHFRYATGELYDNIKSDNDINVQNRLNAGTSHGWAGAQIMFWNVDANAIRCDAPTGAMNWSIGATGIKAEGYSFMAPWEPFGIWQSENIRVSPRSLYYAQLEDRLGTDALRHVILPGQEEAPIWSELGTWEGEGLFGSDVVAWTSGNLIDPPLDSVNLKARVRNLQMLDRGVTTSWSKLSGPGTVTFGDASSLETTATFSATGRYIIRLTVDDGVSPGTRDLPVAYGNSAPTIATGGGQTVTMANVDPWSPALIATTAWFDASDATTITANGSAVSQWNDKSGNGNHATQGVAADRPVTGTQTINGVNALATQASVGEHMDLSSTISLSNHSIFGVLQAASDPVDLPTSMGVLAATQNSWDSYTMTFRDPARGVMRTMSEDDDGTGLTSSMTGCTTLTTPFLFGTVKIKGTSNHFFYNATDLGSAGVQSADLTLGVLFRGYAGDIASSNGQPWDGKVGEIIIINSALSDADREKVEGYLAHKWGLVAGLPTAHPYISTAPGAPTATTFLNGTIGDADGDSLNSTWSVVSGPGTVTFANAAAADTTASFTASGTYTLRLTVSDGFETVYDELTVQVLSASHPYSIWSAGEPVQTDSSGDGISNGIAWVLGASGTSASATDLLPTTDITSDSNYFIFTCRRANEAHNDPNTTIEVIYGDDLSSWSTAVDNGSSVVISETDDFYAAGVDRIEVKLHTDLVRNGKIFARLRVEISP